MIFNVFRNCKVQVVECVSNDENMKKTFFPRSTWTTKEFKTLFLEIAENLEIDWRISVDFDDLTWSDTLVICIEDIETGEDHTQLEVKLLFDENVRTMMASEITGLKF